ncbi:MAG: hypothetical protein A2885_10155 [Sphingopyxis sp. RIFCSPHIGHO2_01_FULL_65_24]|nr:MAG: hypothetical protein A2885_10155 [Sphingopyxis sp. RIFCSPHIGHO2_01_FULL_65_24]
MHVVTLENCEEFTQACRDVLLMFTDIAEEGGRLTDANMWIRFDPLKFVDAVDDGGMIYGNLDLVRSGAALAILCDFYDRWEEERPLVDPITAPFVAAIEEGKLSAFGDIADTVTQALDREKANTLSPWFNKAVQPIYRRYVQSYFASLASTIDWTA